MSGASGLRKHGHTSAGDGGTISLPSDAVDVTYDNSGSGLAATDVQGAVDELDTTLDTFGDPIDIADDTANITGVNFADQGSNPATPAATHTIVFTKSDGLYVKDDGGTVTGPLVDAVGAGVVGSDTIWDAKGDLAVGTGSNTAAKLTVGANDTIPMADSGETTGIKWVASQTPSTQAFSDAAAQGTADTYARGDHKHGMPAASAGGALVFLEAHSASSSASLDFTTFISSTYDTYKIIGTEIVVQTSTAHLLLEMGTGGGPTYDTGNNYEWARNGVTTGGAADLDFASTGICRIFTTMSTAANYGFGSFDLTAYGLQSTALRKTIIGNLQYVTSTGPASIIGPYGMQWATAGTAVTALRFIPSSGNIVSGTIRIYGITKV